MHNLAGCWLLERHSVNGLASTPFLVINVHSTEQLESSASFRHILQPQKGWLKVFLAQLAVAAVGRRE
jgi:hypothetical protein